MRPVTRKILAVQVVVVLIGGMIVRAALSRDPRQGLEERAAVLRDHLARGEDEAAVRALVFGPARRRIGVDLVRVRALLRQRLLSPDPMPEAERARTTRTFREEDLTAVLRRRVVERGVVEYREENLGIYKILLDLEEPAVEPEDLDEPPGVERASELAAVFLGRFLELALLGFDRNSLAVDHLRDITPRRRGDEELDLLEATVRLTDGKRSVDLRFVEERHHYEQRPDWFLDLSTWYEGPPGR